VNSRCLRRPAGTAEDLWGTQRSEDWEAASQMAETSASSVSGEGSQSGLCLWNLSASTSSPARSDHTHSRHTTLRSDRFRATHGSVLAGQHVKNHPAPPHSLIWPGTRGWWIRRKFRTLRWLTWKQ